MAQSLIHQNLTSIRERVLNGSLLGGNQANYAGVVRTNSVRGRTRSTSSVESNDDSGYFLDIFLKKHHPDVDLRLTMEEIDTLIFRTLKIPRDVVVAVSQGDLRYIELKLSVNPAPWQNLKPVYVKDGLTTGGSLTSREQVSWVNISGAPLRTKKETIKDLFDDDDDDDDCKGGNHC